MNTLNKRFVYFLGLCIPARIILALIAKYLPLKYLQLMGLFTFIAGCWFIFAYIVKPYSYSKVITSTKVWWRDIRLIHGITYLLFSYLAINRNKKAWIVLLIDAIIGFLAFFTHHYIIGSFKSFCV